MSRRNQHPTLKALRHSEALDAKSSSGDDQREITAHETQSDVLKTLCFWWHSSPQRLTAPSLLSSSPIGFPALSALFPPPAPGIFSSSTPFPVSTYYPPPTPGNPAADPSSLKVTLALVTVTLQLMTHTSFSSSLKPTGSHAEAHCLGPHLTPTLAVLTASPPLLKLAILISAQGSSLLLFSLPGKCSPHILHGCCLLVTKIALQLSPPLGSLL